MKVTSSRLTDRKYEAGEARRLRKERKLDAERIRKEVERDQVRRVRFIRDQEAREAQRIIEFLNKKKRDRALVP